MFETKTYDYILEDMLSRVTSDVDKREGSVIYDALAPCAYQLAQMYFELNNYIDLFFLDTSVGEFLDRKAVDCGITRKEATYAVRKVVTSGAITIGTRWGIEDTTYVITELLSENIYSVTCEQSGEIGNQYSGILLSLDNIDGQVTVTLTDILASGSDEESDDNLRERMKQYLISPEQDGNVSQYLKWATDFDGIGRAKVFPLQVIETDGAGKKIIKNASNTVTIAITNGAYKHAEVNLINNFQNYIDPLSSGLGNGVAPIGSKVIVTGGSVYKIKISANVILEDGFSDAEAQVEAEKAIIKYLAAVTFVKSRVSYMQIGSVLLDCASISEINNLFVNGETTDVVLLGDEIPELGNLSLTKVTV